MGVSIGALGAVPSAAIAGSSGPSPDEEDNVDDEKHDVEILRETDEYQVSKHTIDRNSDEKNTHIIWVGKESGSVYKKTVEANTFNSMTHKELGIDGEDISPQGHDEIIVDSDGGHGLVGGCSNFRYDIHQEAYLSLELGDTVDELTAGGLEAAICALVGLKYGGPVGAVIGAVGCHAISVLFLDHINPSGTSMTWGAWDCHRGFTGYSNICHGVTGGMEDDVGSIPRKKRVPHTHIEQVYTP